MMRHSFLTQVLLVVVAVLLTAGCYKRPEMPPQVTPEVLVMQAFSEKVQLYNYTTGETSSEANVNVVARVSGFLEERYFQDSAIVKEGDPLFRIEQDQYKANLDAANAAVEVAKAKVALATANAERAKPLAESRAISAEEYQTRVAEYQEAVAYLTKAQADARLAKLNLDYTQVYAPVSGMVSTAKIDVGNLVGSSPENSLLTNIQQMNPIRVDFNITDVEFNAFVSRLAEEAANTAANTTINTTTPAVDSETGTVARSSGTRRGDTVPPVTELPAMTPATHEKATPILQGHAQKILLDIALPTHGASNKPHDADYRYTGELTAIDNTIQADTGQIRIRGKIANPDYRIFPNQICRVRFYYPRLTELLLVQEEAIVTDLSEKYLLLVGADGTVERRNVTIGDQIDAKRRVITAGLSEGETYIVRGLQKARIGEKVMPKPLTQD